MKYSFHPEAEAEFLEAIDYYEDCANGLGHDFAVEVYSAIGRVIAHPQAWPILEGEVRRCLAGRFPYAVLYALGGDHVYVLAVMNLHRDPVYWQERLR